MNKIISTIKDFLYNITDYGLIVGVVVVMVVILVWRFGILFNIGVVKEPIEGDTPPPPKVEDPVTPPDTADTPDPEPGAEQPPVDPDSVNPDPGINNPIVTVTINIPSGTMANKIGDILLENNLIGDKVEFLNRANELKLDTRLHSGTFNIDMGTPLDDIIKILAGVD